MKKWTSAEEIVDFAILNEEEAAAFYRDLATRSDSLQMRTIFEGFAREEDGHRLKLLGIKSGGGFRAPVERILDLKIGDYLVEVKPSGCTDYQRSLIVAMHQEKAAFKLYNDLAEATEDPGLKQIMLSLAQEEAKHKLRFEIEYDENILTDN
jgi:rubrerythrin